MDQKGVSASFAELIGTFLLTLFIAIAVSDATGLKVTDFAVIGLVHAFVLSMLVATLGGASGGHFNPAVTIALAVLRKITLKDALVYVVLQMAGAILAVLLVDVLFAAPADVANFGAPVVNETLASSREAGILGELIGTFALMFAIMGMAVNPRNDQSWAPWIIGATLGAAVFTIGPITGGAFNPARAFGPALFGSAFDGFGTWVLIYWVGPVVGAVLAALTYQALIIRPAASLRPVDKLES